MYLEVLKTLGYKKDDLLLEDSTNLGSKEDQFIFKSTCKLLRLIFLSGQNDCIISYEI